MRWIIYDSSRWHLAYCIDMLVIGMFAAAALDTSTTCFFVSRSLGIEKNPALALLIKHSQAWIPVYILLCPLLVPFLPEVPRRAFALYFLLSGLSYGINNFVGIFFGRYFLLERLGFWKVDGLCAFSALVLFVYDLYTRIHNPDERRKQFKTAFGGICICSVIEGAFYLLGSLL